jgi:hypothetical protein
MFPNSHLERKRKDARTCRNIFRNIKHAVRLRTQFGRYRDTIHLRLEETEIKWSSLTTIREVYTAACPGHFTPRWEVTLSQGSEARILGRPARSVVAISTETSRPFQEGKHCFNFNEYVRMCRSARTETHVSSTASSVASSPYCAMRLLQNLWLHKSFSFLWRYSPIVGLGLPPWNSLFHFGFLDLR